MFLRITHQKWWIMVQHIQAPSVFLLLSNFGKLNETAKSIEQSATISCALSGVLRRGATPFMNKDGKLEVFIAYARADKQHLVEFHKHLSSLKRENVVSIWYDGEILCGDRWESELKPKLESADIIIALISSDFIASEYCWEQELSRGIERHEEGSARLFPLLLRKCDWNALRHIQLVPSDGLAVTSWPNQDKAYTDVVKHLRKVIEDFNRKGEPLSKQTKQASKQNTLVIDPCPPWAKGNQRVIEFWFGILDMKLPWPIRDYMEGLCSRAAQLGVIPDGHSVDSQLKFTENPTPCLHVSASIDDGKVWTFYKPFQSKEEAANFCKQWQLPHDLVTGLIDLRKSVQRKIKLLDLLRTFQLEGETPSSTGETVSQIVAPQTMDLEVEIHAIYQKQNIVPKASIPQWGFELQVFAKNAGIKNIRQYHVEVAVPSGMLNLGNVNDFNELRERRSEFERVYTFPTGAKTEVKELLPGKRERLGTIYCLFNQHNEHLRGQVIEGSITVDVYAEDMKNKRKKFPVKELDPYRVIAVLPENLVYEQSYPLGVIQVK